VVSLRGAVCSVFGIRWCCSVSCWGGPWQELFLRGTGRVASLRLFAACGCGGALVSFGYRCLVCGAWGREVPGRSVLGGCVVVRVVMGFGMGGWSPGCETGGARIGGGGGDYVCVAQDWDVGGGCRGVGGCLF